MREIDSVRLSGDPREEYARRLSLRREAFGNREKLRALLERVRVLVFVVAVAVGFAAFGAAIIPVWWLLIPVALFWALGVKRQAAADQRGSLSRAVSFYERGIARLDGRWPGTGEAGTRFLTEDRLYARDLDVFGQGSLFELLCLARTRMGEETLAAWLMAPAPPDIVRARQAAVAELAPRLDLREDLAVLGEKARDGVHTDELAVWGERQPLLDPSPFRIVAWMLSLFGAAATVSLIALFLNQIDLLQISETTSARLRAYSLVVAIVCGLILWRFKKRTTRIIREVTDAARDIGLLAEVLKRLEVEEFASARLAALRADLDTAGRPPSRRIARLNKLVELLDSRAHLVMQFAGPLLLWDLHLSYFVEAWRRTSGSAMRRWLTAVGEMEALSSLAGYRYDHPLDTFPEFVEETPCFEAQGLAHPLLAGDRAVANDVHVGGDVRVLVVSGSNMSGKSTLLRAVGLNAVLAQTGSPVRAWRLRMSPLAVGASITVQDSLQSGVSRFYAEITQLRRIIEKTSGTLPVLFLIDEVLHGTNSHDRRIGAEAIVRGLLERSAIGLVTTHDLALARIADALGPRGANVHFGDYLEGGQMRFDYCLRPGVVENSNAIELMRSVGLEV